MYICAMKLIRTQVFLAVFAFSMMLISADANAQCAMCRSQVESSIEGQGKVVGRGLNDGILYLISSTYLTLPTIIRVRLRVVERM